MSEKVVWIRSIGLLLLVDVLTQVAIRFHKNSFALIGMSLDGLYYLSWLITFVITFFAATSSKRNHWLLGAVMVLTNAVFLSGMNYVLGCFTKVDFEGAHGFVIVFSLMLALSIVTMGIATLLAQLWKKRLRKEQR